MKKHLTLFAFVFIATVSLTSCTQSLEVIDVFGNPEQGRFFQYYIRQGKHTANFNSYIPVHDNDLNFVVRFDSTAIYQTTDPSNQTDINKLYGFSDNDAHHHEYSARFGWNWNHGSLRIFAYVYNNGTLITQEMTGILLNVDYNCSIKITGDQYIFSINNTSISLPRLATTHSGDGYKLYPYFGGDETAPHDIRIWIKEL